MARKKRKTSEMATDRFGIQLGTQEAMLLSQVTKEWQSRNDIFAKIRRHSKLMKDRYNVFNDLAPPKGDLLDKQEVNGRVMYRLKVK